ncbi:MAG: thioesterase family protein [bacterium]
MKHSIPIQLRFNDTDALGHINNSTYFSFYDLGKSEYFRAIHGTNYFSEEIDIVVAHAEVDFIEPVFLTDDIAVQTRVARMGNKSFTLEQQIIDTKSGGIKCKCTTIMVGYDFKTKATKIISEHWRRAAAKYEDRPDFLK